MTVDFLPENIKYMRHRLRLTQEMLAARLEIKRPLIGAYEEGRATPKIPVLRKMSEIFQTSIDELVGCDLTLEGGKMIGIRENSPSVLTVVVNSDNEERIPIVQQKAVAGYLNGYADPEFVGQLPSFSFPIAELSAERTYRVFQIQGDSMLPVTSGAYVFCEFIEKISTISDGKTYIIVTREDGIVYKRLVRQKGNQLLLISDNPEYRPYMLNGTQVMELWKARGILSFDLSAPEQIDLGRIAQALGEMKEELRKLSS